jgi:hypothetical protein
MVLILMSDVTFGTWSVPASPIIVEYSVVVVEEIRHEVAEGFQKLSRGGIEVGGLLYGVREGQTVRITAIRAAACEHAAGPAFRLSERDRAALREQIRLDREDPRLKGLECIGWYVSHTRSEITLTESDQEIFNTYFGQPWQVTLVIRPSRGGNMRAGFFVRNEDGSLAPAQSHLEFNFPDRMAGMPEHRVPFTERRPPEPRTSYRAVEQTIAAPPEAPRTSPVASSRPVSNIPTSTMSSPGITSLFGEPATPQESPDLTSQNGTKKAKAGSGKKWFWMAAVLVIIGAMVVAGARYLSFPVPNESMALSVLEREGQLNIEWNRSAQPVAKAVRGTLEIADGAKSQTIPLAPADLAQGKFAYKRATGDIQVRMSVEAPNGTKLQEASRFLGPPPSAGNAAELKALEQRRDELDAEVARLKQSNDQQAQRIQQLERTLKILQTRPGN